MDFGDWDFPPDLVERAAAETAALQGEVVNGDSVITFFIAHVADRAALLRKCLVDIPELVVIVGGAGQGLHGRQPMVGKGRDTARAQREAWCTENGEPFPATYDYFISFLDGTLAALRDDFPGRVRTGPVGRSANPPPSSSVWHVWGANASN